MMSDREAATQEGGIQAAIAAIIADERRAQRERLAREAIPQLMREIDAMIVELEELNLQGRGRVPDRWRPRLVRLYVRLPFAPRMCIPARPSPTQLLDVLFDLQEALLRSRARPQHESA